MFLCAAHIVCRESFSHFYAHPCCWLARLMRPNQSGGAKPAKPAHTYMHTHIQTYAHIHTYIHNLIQPQEDKEEEEGGGANLDGSSWEITNVFWGEVVTSLAPLLSHVVHGKLPETHFITFTVACGLNVHLCSNTHLIRDLWLMIFERVRFVL